MRELKDAALGPGLERRASVSVATIGMATLALLLGSVAAAMGQPRDGIWEGGEFPSFRIRFAVRGNGTEVVAGGLDSFQVVCPNPGRFRSIGVGFGALAPILDGRFTVLRGMVTPKRAEAGDNFGGFVVRGTFVDDLHAEGTANGWLPTFSGQGVRAQTCVLPAMGWKASWVRELPPPPTSSGSGSVEEPTGAGGLGHELGTWPELAAIESARTVHLQGTADGGPHRYTAVLYVELQDPNELEAAVEPRSPD